MRATLIGMHLPLALLGRPAPLVRLGPQAQLGRPGLPKRALVPLALPGPSAQLAVRLGQQARRAILEQSVEPARPAPVGHKGPRDQRALLAQ